MLRTLRLYFLLCCCFADAIGQQPSYDVLGENTLDGADIYDIHQSADGLYWIATDKGVLRFDGYTYTPLPCEDMLSSGAFALTEDHQSRVYFHNLSGQVFLIENGQCRLHYNLPDSLLTSDIDLEVDDLNRLIISARRIIAIDSIGEVTLLDQAVLGAHQMTGVARNHTSKVLRGYNHLQSTLVTLDHGILTSSPCKRPATSDGAAIVPFDFNGKLYGYDRSTNELLSISTHKIQVVAQPAQILGSHQIMRCYATKESVWLAMNTFGVLRLDSNLQPTNGKELLFQNHFISCVHQDLEGNILLGTFGNGILLITNAATQDITALPNDENFITIAQTSNELFFGTRSGKIYRMTDDRATDLFRSKQLKSVELLEPLAENRILIGELESTVVNIKSGEEHDLRTGSIKDVARYKNGKYLLATNRGAFILDPDSNTFNPIPDLNLRLYCIAYDSIAKTIYAGASRGLAQCKDRGVTFFPWEDRHITAQDMEFHNGQMLVGTAEHGLLVFRDDQLLKSDGFLHAQEVSIVKQHANHIYLATKQGIEVYDSQGELIHLINQSDGLHSENIEDFEIRGNTLWIAYGQGVQTVQLNQIRPFEYTPKLQVNAMWGHEGTNRMEDGMELQPDQNNVQFELRVQSLRYQQEVRYHYRLEGTEDSWHEQPFQNNEIIFRALSPGTYTFRAIARCRDHESTEQQISFTIAAPFWKTWWFYGAAAALLLLVITLIYNRQLHAQRNEALRINELNASKLTAIQSQMNPHFIFNALNSIQDLVLKGDIDNSYTYITQFADLVRSTLKASDSELIELSEETKLIELYLSLEKLRFKDDFTFEIHAMETEDVMIPPMLIQPFIENALVHGLMHKEGVKHIHIQFELNDRLQCIITDNGIGRVHAEHIKGRRKQSHESFSVRAIRKRFDILKDHFKGEFGFYYEDLQENEHPSGTRVTLTIPVKRVF